MNSALKLDWCAFKFHLKHVQRAEKSVLKFQQHEKVSSS